MQDCILTVLFIDWSILEVFLAWITGHYVLHIQWNMSLHMQQPNTGLWEEGPSTMADTVEYRLTNMSHYGLLAVASQETPSANLVTYMHARSAPQLRVTAQHPVITCLASHNTLNSLCNMVCKDYQTVALTSNSLIPRPFPASFQHRVSCLDCKYTSSHIEQPHSQAIPSLIPRPP